MSFIRLAIGAVFRRQLQRFKIRGRQTGITTSTDGKTDGGEIQLSLGSPPTPGQHFYIPTDTDVDRLHKETNHQDLILIRGPPAAGKSTVAEALVRKHSHSNRGDNTRNQRAYIYLSGLRLEGLHDVKSVTATIATMVKENLGDDLPDDVCLTDIHQTMAWLTRKNIAVVFDEAHFLFEMAKDDVLKKFIVFS